MVKTIDWNLSRVALQLPPDPESDSEFMLRDLASDILVQTFMQPSIKAGHIRVHRVSAYIFSHEVHQNLARIARESEALALAVNELFRKGMWIDAIRSRYQLWSADFVLIDSLVVAPAYRGKGVTKRAMEALLRHFGDTCELIVVPVPADEPAREPLPPVTFWETLGFRLVTRSLLLYGANISQQPEPLEAAEIRGRLVKTKGRAA